MKVSFLAEVAQQLDDAVRFYNQERLGLDFEFAEEVRNALTE